MRTHDERINHAHDLGARAENKIMTHEAVCAERYKQIQSTINDVKYGQVRLEKRIETQMRIRDYVQAATLLAVLFGPGVAADVVKKFLGL